ncbi:methyltransferase domain-containing protein [Rickettsiella endosymbiont of Rhagonycha lignosa]|uniref:methyltransferase domain-containing protein n=1 Tax=Rickettsiella endosymbiont of Rhagonycha lignosa TaxID=3077937 RepID=UPI00313E7658
MIKKDWDPAKYTQCSDFQYNAAIKFLETCSFKSGASILDIGCGNGKTTHYIASQLTSGQVIGIDKSADMIKFATAHFKRDNLHFQVTDVERLNYTAKYDAAVSFFCIPWVTNKALAFQNIAKILKNKGDLYILAAIYEKSQAELITRLTQKPHWQKYFENYQSPFSYLNDTNYEDYARNAGIHVNSMEKINIQHAFKNRAEFHFFYLTLVPQISHLREENQKNAFADELLEDYFKAKGKQEYSLTIEAIKFSGRKLTCSMNLHYSHSKLAFFPTPETNEENEQDNDVSFLRLKGG